MWLRIERSESLQDRDSVEIQQGDFLSPSGDGLLEDASLPLSRQTFDAIIANPPYIKHHMLSPQLKTLLKRRYEHYLGVRVSKLSSIYIYFFLESIRRLEPEGRLVFITPTEFLDVSYGRAVKEALLGHCSIDEIIVYGEDELTFGDDVLSTSAITVATRSLRFGRDRLLVRRQQQLHAATVPWPPMGGLHFRSS